MRLLNLSLILLGLLFAEGAPGTDYEYDAYGYVDYYADKKTPAPTPKPTAEYTKEFSINGQTLGKEYMYNLASQLTKEKQSLVLHGLLTNGPQLKSYLDSIYAPLYIKGEPATQAQLYAMAEDMIRVGKNITFEGKLLNGRQFMEYLDERFSRQRQVSSSSRSVLRTLRNRAKKAYQQVKGTRRYVDVARQKYNASMLSFHMKLPKYRDIIVAEIFETNGTAGVLKYEKKDARLYDVARFYTCVLKSDAKAKYGAEVDLPNQAFRTLASTNYTALNDNDAGVHDNMTCILDIKMKVKFPDGATDIEKEVFSKLFASIAMGTEKGVFDAVYKYNSMFGYVDFGGVKKRLPCQCADPDP